MHIIIGRNGNIKTTKLCRAIIKKIKDEIKATARRIVSCSLQDLIIRR